MKLRPEEITSILRERIEKFDVETDLAEVGAVLTVGDGIARVHGLENCLALEMLDLEHGVTGLAFNLEEDNVGVALFGEWDKVKEGEPVRRSGKVASVQLKVSVTLPDKTVHVAMRRADACRIECDMAGHVIEALHSKVCHARCSGRERHQLENFHRG